MLPRVFYAQFGEQCVGSDWGGGAGNSPTLFQIMILQVAVLERKVILFSPRPAFKVEKPV